MKILTLIIIAVLLTIGLGISGQEEAAGVLSVLTKVAIFFVLVYGLKSVRFWSKND